MLLRKDLKQLNNKLQEVAEMTNHRKMMIPFMTCSNGVIRNNKIVLNCKMYSMICGRFT